MVGTCPRLNATTGTIFSEQIVLLFLWRKLLQFNLIGLPSIVWGEDVVKESMLRDNNRSERRTPNTADLSFRAKNYSK